MKNAIEAVKNGLGLKKASENFGVPKISDLYFFLGDIVVHCWETVSIICCERKGRYLVYCKSLHIVSPKQTLNNICLSGARRNRGAIMPHGEVLFCPT